MSGGSYEYTAVFNKSYSGDYFSNTNVNYKPAEGKHFATTNGNSTSYATAYINSENAYNGVPLVYSVSKTGDRIKEVYTGNSNISWHSDYARFVYSSSPFALRGGSCDFGAYAGVFSSIGGGGHAGSGLSFRVALAL